ncbi:hypothetical protein SYJ56_01630 [Algoriphagus sp. D3-2-R+10]|uniref:hypothetical protein n=1 Tax=Algoriphagus aurantiacus TaxID=3103948 RepID=UPI002B3998BF|nr:hypothetical protein [Algoriphagus sp. D3-2-R+10]MEB2773987.1 hypothetical protein [Algoriphagus sp. D3-2-R+10]
MPQRQKANNILSPELIKILKIFGLVSVGLVLLLSFFNTKRANNTGKDTTFRMASSNRIYFLNVRAINYDRETRSDAGMVLFRHWKREISENKASLDLVIILNSQKEEAYIYMEPVNMDWPLEIRVSMDGKQEEVQLQNGNNSEFLKYVRQLEPWIANDAKFEIRQNSAWVDIWSTPKEKEALKTLVEDYFRLIDERR